MHSLDPALLEDMESKGIDPDLTCELLDAYNSGAYDGQGPVLASGVPEVDGRDVIDVRSDGPFRFDAPAARRTLGRLGLDARQWLEFDGESASCDLPGLARLGTRLFEFTAFGILNGGSATSYADTRKNRAFGERAFQAWARHFDMLAPACAGKPKGVTPAWINPDGSPGESFLVARFRALLLMKAAWKESFGEARREPLPLFQMTSIGTDAEIREAYDRYAKHPWLAPLAARLGVRPAFAMTAVQPLIAAYSHSSEGRPKRVFDRAYGRENTTIALPGGHGQCFRVLKDVFAELAERGYRWAYFGNVDNVASLPDPVEIALLALSGRKAGFDFSYRTPVDVKGGVLVLDGQGRKNCADIGPAIAFSEVERLEREGRKILFNCATGLFDLEWMVPEIDRIATSLPVRFSDQDKDAGKYSQAEQVTWEVMGLLDDFLGFAVRKQDRFIAAKLLMETILTSGVDPDADPGLDPALEETTGVLRDGLGRLLAEKVGLRLENGRWTARD